MFRSTPLWGIGQRIFFLHDGRTSDLLAAIQAHAAIPGEDEQGDHGAQESGNHRNNYPPSEATAVIRKFNGLSSSDKQSILDFLRSL
jgi:hypothetical protein